MKTTFSRTFFPAAIVLLAALLLVGFSLRALVLDFLTDRSVEGLKNDAEAISSLASAYYTEGSLSGRDFLVNLSLASQVSGADAVIFSKSGELVLCSDAPLGCRHQGLIMNESYVQQVLSAGMAINTGTFPGLYEEARYIVSVPISDAFTGSSIGFVMVSSTMESSEIIIQRITDIYLMVSLLTVLAAGIIMTVYARKQSAPLREMADAAIAFGHGDLTARVKADDAYTQEIEELAIAFNNMATSLQKSEYQRREFVANVSHELKTPMTTIGGYIDGMLDGTIPESRQKHYMQIVSDETKRLSRLVRSMLDISRLQDQGGIPDEKKTRFDLEECAGQALIQFEQKITDKALQVDVSLPEHPVFTFANQDYIMQVIYNLLDNAVKFSPHGGTLGFSIQEGGSKAYISISNEGQTIPPEELPLVFDRFHKLDKSRAQNRDGWGLGLYIVKTIICSHGEDISVSSKNGKTEFTFTLPLVI
ncbi:MAG: HAMP domain-containing histidine kinase [Oscillospiraceae bacterium]|nr:HAMP domain-containing histidine kinase [Oscillospiraceae bacterium]